MKNKKNNSDSVLFGSVTVGAKGQFVIPVDARNKLGILPGDQLLVFGNNSNSVLDVIKADEVSKLLGDLTTIQ